MNGLEERDLRADVGGRGEAEAANEAEGGVETVLSAAGHAFGDRAGGTSGILWGLLLEGVGKGLGNTEAVTSKRLADAVQGSAQHLQGFSKAQLGDKTMLDALFPFWSSKSMLELRSPKHGSRQRTPAEARQRQRHHWCRRLGGPGRWLSAAWVLRIQGQYRSA